MSLRCLPLRSPTLPPATHTNCYLLGPDDALVVVDPASPYAHEQARLQAEIEATGQVAAILLTHHHHDHIGGVEALRSWCSTPVLAHPLTADRVPFAVDRQVSEGEVIGGFTLLHTPGHATGHLVLWNPKTRDLVAGDMVAGEGTIVLEPPEGDLEDYLQSLERLGRLGAERVHPAHGPVLDSGVFPHYIEHRNARSQQIRQALSATPQSPMDLVTLVYGDTIPRAVYPLAARQVLCHLQWLEGRRQARELDEGWVHVPPRNRGVREDFDDMLGSAATDLRGLLGRRNLEAVGSGARKVAEGLSAVAGELFDVALDQSARRRTRVREKASQDDSES